MHTLARIHTDCSHERRDVRQQTRRGHEIEPKVKTSQEAIDGEHAQDQLDPKAYQAHVHEDQKSQIRVRIRRQQPQIISEQGPRRDVRHPDRDVSALQRRARPLLDSLHALPPSTSHARHRPLALRRRTLRLTFIRERHRLPSLEIPVIERAPSIRADIRTARRVRGRARRVDRRRRPSLARP